MFANKDSRILIKTVVFSALAYILLSVIIFIFIENSGIYILILGICMAAATIASVAFFLKKRNSVIEKASEQIDNYISGEKDIRLDEDEEGELFRLFHSVNQLVTILDAHRENEQSSKEFLKGTISEISHQLKTPLAALNVYNGIIKDEIKDNPDALRFCNLTEDELDRIETLVLNLLKLTKIDGKTARFHKKEENLADLLQDIFKEFSYRCEKEKKKFYLTWDNDATLLCDKDWLYEAISNVVKNAIDYTGPGDYIEISLKKLPSSLMLTIKDSGMGIHPEDIHHIFKRFFCSRFSKDKTSLGLGLSLAKSIIEEHTGTIEVESEPGSGTIFTIIFLNPTEL